MLDEVERFADQKEKIRNQTMQALEQSAREEARVDGRVDCNLTTRLGTDLSGGELLTLETFSLANCVGWRCGAAKRKCGATTAEKSEKIKYVALEKKAKRLGRQLICITLPQDSDEPNWGDGAAPKPLTTSVCSTPKGWCCCTQSVCWPC